MNISYENGVIVSVVVDHPKLMSLTFQERLLCYGETSTQAIGEATNSAETAWAKKEPDQVFVDAAADAMVAAGFITTQRANEIKA